MKKRYITALVLIGALLMGIGTFCLFGVERLYALDETQPQEATDVKSQSSAITSALFDFQKLDMEGTSLSMECNGLRAMISDDGFEGLMVVGDDGALIMNKAYLESIVEQADDTVEFSLSVKGNTCAARIKSNGSTIWGQSGLCIVSVPYESGTLTTAVKGNQDSYIGNSAYFSDGFELRWQLGISETYTITDNLKSFTDITGHWGKSYVEFLSAHGVLNGVSESNFQPDRSITRAEFVKILAVLSSEDVASCQTNRFTDVTSDHWFYRYVAWGTERGLVQGKSADRFAPNATITREEMATLCDRYISYYQLECKAVRAATDFADAPVIGSWALDAVKRIQAAGIINGRDNNMFVPKGNATRAEAATMLSNLTAYMMTMPH
ncbi:MAG: S-layer homology domain-containing protein [Bacillota bacterium]|nr:S-layer homology domain-containing protein [Bacillota bacterium]